MKTAVIYARVSSSNDRQDTSRQIEDLKVWDMALKGGWIMAVLAVLSVVCFYIFPNST